MTHKEAMAKIESLETTIETINSYQFTDHALELYHLKEFLNILDRDLKIAKANRWDGPKQLIRQILYSELRGKELDGVEKYLDHLEENLKNVK